MSAITTHVLDTARGRPAAGVPIVLSILATKGWQEIGKGVTDGDGRAKTLLEPGELAQGTYRLVFETGAYFRAHSVEGFYPEVVVTFQVRDGGGHYHVPLLLSPYGYSTYRGS